MKVVSVKSDAFDCAKRPRRQDAKKKGTERQRNERTKEKSCAVLSSTSSFCPSVPPSLSSWRLGVLASWRNERLKGIRAAVLTLITCLAFSALPGCDIEKKQVARALAGGDPDKGEAAILDYGCASCHTIPGIHGADALVGPPLTKMGGRMYIAGVMQNTPQNLIRWLEDPPAVDAKTAMPNLHVKENDARDIATYLYTLQ